MTRGLAFVCCTLAGTILAPSHSGAGGKCCGGGPPPPSGTCAPPAAAAAVAASPEKTAGIPKLIDLGRTFCIPCKKMAPILAGLKKDYTGRMDVEFIDVGDRPEEAKKYGIRMIPTQIFFDASGKELSRHEGFFSKEDILSTWKKHGVEVHTIKVE